MNLVAHAMIGTAGLIFATMASLNSPALANDLPRVIVDQVNVGWHGHFQIGRWTQIQVPIDSSNGASKVNLQVSAVDSDGNKVVFVSGEVDVASPLTFVPVNVKIGRLNGEIEIRLRTGGAPACVLVPGGSDRFRNALKPSTKMIVITGEPNGFDFENDATRYGTTIKVISAKAEELPTNALAYDSVSSLVLAGSLNLSQEQCAALRDWVSSGGRLVISLRQETPVALESMRLLKDWLPISVGDEPAIVREFGGLEAFSGRTVRMPYKGTLAIPSLKMEQGEVLAASRSDAFLARAPYGMGSVSILAMDLTRAPLSEWKALSPFCARLAGLTPIDEGLERTVNRGTQLSSTGITDLATQIHATLENFEQVSRPTPWFVIGLLFLLLVVIGPVDFLLVHQWLKKPQLTWITFPCWILLFTTVAFQASASLNGSISHTNQLDIVNIDVTTGTARGRHLFNLYSPTTLQKKVSVQAVPLAKSSSANPTARVCWQGVPESTFGGMLRETGFEQGAEYVQQPDGQLIGLPIMQCSSKSLEAESLQSAEGLVTCDLKASSTGRLTGTIVHRFSDSLEDWMVVYKTVAYRQLKTRDDQTPVPLAPNQIWRVEQPTVFSRELKPFLTGIVTMATPLAGIKAGSTSLDQQTNYDPVSLDPLNVVRTLTFHEHIGAERYTGLTNQIYNHEDCSHLLKLGRAILFARLKQSVALVKEGETAIQPDRRTTFIRVIMPVAPPTSLMKDLRRVVPD